MKRVGVIMAVGAAAGLLGESAYADELVATKPGVMCTSAESLAKLTLPNGDSRTHAVRPAANDLGIAAAGGCIDIPLGGTVQVVQAFKNTSRVHFVGPSAPTQGLMVVPNVDFERSGAVASTAPSVGGPAPGYTAVQKLPGGDGTTVVLLLDRRISPATRDLLWGTGDADGSFENYPELKRQFTRGAPVNAELQLLSRQGAVVETRRLERPLAKLEPAPIHGLPSPALLLTVDYGIGMGGFNGPFSDLLSPQQRGLAPVEAAAPGGKREPISLASTLHDSWKIVPARQGGPEEIESARCSRVSEAGAMHYTTYRFVAGQWVQASRVGGACEEIEDFPARREFP